MFINSSLSSLAESEPLGGIKNNNDIKIKANNTFASFPQLSQSFQEQIDIDISSKNKKKFISYLFHGPKNDRKTTKIMIRKWYKLDFLLWFWA